MLNIVDQIDQLCVDLVDQTLRETAQVQPPTVHLLSEEFESPYLGCVTCRPFYPGEDAATAVTAMGLLASMVDATRLVASWEYHDLSVALQLPGADQAPSGVVVLDAERARSGHTVRWHPLRVDAVEFGGALHVRPVWGAPRRHHDVELPEPVRDLLAAWRNRKPGTWPDSDIVRNYDGLEAVGYTMRWPARDPREPLPSWMRALELEAG